MCKSRKLVTFRIIMLLATFLFLGAMGQTASAQACDCCQTTACPPSQWCYYGGECVINGADDGKCGPHNPGITSATPEMRQALGLYLEGFEIAAAGVGGPTDPTLFSQAQLLPLTLAQRNVIEEIAKHVTALVFGQSSDAPPGIFTPAATTIPAVVPGDLGTVGAANADTVSAAQLVRQGILAEIQNPGVFSSFSSQIPAGYQFTGRCGDLTPLPYTTNLECLDQEVLASIHSISALGVSALSEWGAIILALSLCSAAALVIRRWGLF